MQVSAVKCKTENNEICNCSSSASGIYILLSYTSVVIAMHNNNINFFCHIIGSLLAMIVIAPGCFILGCGMCGGIMILVHIRILRKRNNVGKRSTLWTGLNYR